VFYNNIFLVKVLENKLRTMIKLRRMRWTGNVASVEEKRDANRILVEKPKI
jgi:hypothetical protein